MKFVMEMVIPSKERLKICIISGMKLRYGNIEDKVTINQIKDFDIGDTVLPSDVTNMLLGSCLGELLGKQKIEMTRIE